MAYNLSTVRNKVLNGRLDDASYDPAIVDGFINDAQRSIFNTYELPFMEKVFNGTLPSGVTVISYPDDYQLQQSMVLNSTTTGAVDITDNYVPFRDFNSRFPVPDSNEAGKPSLWTTYGNKLYLSHPTNEDYTLTMFYLKTPTELVDNNDVPEVPEAFQETLVLGAYYRILERNEDFDQAAYIKNGSYLDELEKMVNRLSKRQTGTPQRMAQPMRAYRGRAARRS